MPPTASSGRTQSRLVLVIVLLALLGALDSAYLIWVHYNPSQAFCAGIGDCELVNQSPYAQVMGVPVALLGLGAYVVLMGLGAVRWRGGASLPLDLTLFGLALAGTAYSAYLTYVEFFVLGEVCLWCVISALLITVIFVLSLAALVRG